MNINQIKFSSSTAIILLDFDNVFKQPIDTYSVEQIELDLKDIVRFVISKSEGIERILIRLYGGWYMKSTLTPRASILQQYLANIRIFPYLSIEEKINIKGQIEIATSLFMAPQIQWENTYREKYGISKVRVLKEEFGEQCVSNPGSCPLKILTKFTKKKTKVCQIESCGVVHNDAIRGYEQKMVDTMMVCDLISSFQDDEVKALYLFTNDTDIFPSLIQARLHNNSGELFLLFNYDNIRDEYSLFLNELGIHTIQLS